MRKAGSQKVVEPINEEAVVYVKRSISLAAALLAIPALCLALECSAALASEPTGAFAVFKQCPRFSKEVQQNEISCVYDTIQSGEVKVGRMSVPITDRMVLQGGVITNNETEAQRFVSPLNGETLSRSPQKIPGGLAGSPLYATLELAGPASDIGIDTNNLINSEGIAVTLPLRVRLEGSVLGPECFIGSGASPIVLRLTTGTTSPPLPNRPLSGKVGDLEFRQEPNATKLEEITGNTLVDNAFAAPKATGCDGLHAPLVDSLLDSYIGLPSAAGKNTAIENDDVEKATAHAVILSEQ
jgi:hypothetical protein